jgi:hypothetical protein
MHADEAIARAVQIMAGDKSLQGGSFFQRQDEI